MIQKIGVVGAGTMGCGIALAAAQYGFSVVLVDINPATIVHAKTQVEKNLDFLLSKQKITAEEKVIIIDRIVFSSDINDCTAGLIIEAIVEKPEAKTSLFNQLATINLANTIFASNTSSLSISLIQKEIPSPDRVVGMHFFNPANVMKLVEVVMGASTSRSVAETVMDICRQMKKSPVLCNDAPGFIVNRVARHYYLEAMKMVEQGVATLETIDAAMEAAGFKMGPFRLMDLIGMDINYAVSESIYHAFHLAERFKPSPVQHEKVTAGELGRKTGKGFYQYS
ncbi:MAG: 3-hydroxybutyryl-CoA dehydrogenase [Ferruginibacter sp.]|nr:3-hydroxybutyryl-CoA dehydrogenase [Ferruginibacter sp.]